MLEQNWFILICFFFKAKCLSIFVSRKQTKNWHNNLSPKFCYYEIIEHAGNFVITKIFLWDSISTLMFQICFDSLRDLSIKNFKIKIET